MIKCEGKLYKTAECLATLYKYEYWPVKNPNEQKVHIADIRIFRCAGGFTLEDCIRNKFIRGSFGVAPIHEKLMEKRLQRDGHLMRRPQHSILRSRKDTARDLPHGWHG